MNDAKTANTSASAFFADLDVEWENTEVAKETPAKKTLGVFVAILSSVVVSVGVSALCAFIFGTIASGLLS